MIRVAIVEDEMLVQESRSAVSQEPEPVEDIPACAARVRVQFISASGGRASCRTRPEANSTATLSAGSSARRWKTTGSAAALSTRAAN